MDEAQVTALLQGAKYQYDMNMFTRAQQAEFFKAMNDALGQDIISEPLPKPWPPVTEPPVDAPAPPVSPAPPPLSKTAHKGK